MYFYFMSQLIVILHIYKIILTCSVIITTAIVIHENIDCSIDEIYAYDVSMVFF